MTFRWYRSRSFWFGLAGLVMLLAMWICGMRSSQYFGVVRPASITYVEKDSAVIEFGYFDFSEAAEMGILLKPGPRWQVIRYPADHPSPVFPPAWGYEKTSDGSIYIRIGIWLIVTLYTVVWLVCMVWWLRRKHRLMNVRLPENSAGVASHPVA